MKKQVTLTIVFGLLPFLLVWVAFFFTGFAFTPKDVFNYHAFWGFSVIYWVVFYLCAIIPTIWDNK
jgi:hypothetical protein